jgi:hypothetical protein
LWLSREVRVFVGGLVGVSADDDFDLLLIPELVQLVKLKVVAG